METTLTFHSVDTQGVKLGFRFFNLFINMLELVVSSEVCRLNQVILDGV